MNSFIIFDLEGNEILNLLNNNFPPKISKIFDEIINKRKDIIREKTGLSFDPFLRKYPIEIDDAEIQRVTLEQSSKKENNIFDPRQFPHSRRRRSPPRRSWQNSATVAVQRIPAR